MNYRREFSELVGKTAIDIKASEDEVVFTMSDGSKYKLYHEQDCCERVSIEDVEGDWSDIIGNPILQAEESSNNDVKPSEYAESWTWTFYKLATIKGYLTIRWLGESNGYYSESVDFVIAKEDGTFSMW